jgi:NAD+ synthetase
MPVLNPDALITNRVEAIRKYHEDAGIQRAELDVSGGIDSAVMLMLLARAVGVENVTAVYSSINSTESSRNRARLVAEAAGVKLVELELGPVFDMIVGEGLKGLQSAGYDMAEVATRTGDDAAVKGSLRSTLRAPVGRFMNRLTGGGIRHGTGNEDEDRWLRFYQKGGDGEVDTNPLAMLSKGEVYQLAVALGVPEEIVVALPTPDLWGTGETHNDEDELTRLSGVEWTYSRVDPKTGQYQRVGTIERMSRCLDYAHGNSLTVEEQLFKGADPSVFYLEYMKFGLTVEHLASAQKWERITRHKLNPNCPTLGSRKELLAEGLVTDKFPST